MNSLSWFLYWADVAGKMYVSATVVLILGLIVAGAAGVFFPLILMTIDEFEPYLATARKGIKILAIVWVCAGVVFLATPSKNTLYAIAASEVGEQVVKSEKVQGIASDATKALQQWIKKQIEPEEKK